MSNINSTLSKLDSFTIVDLNVFYQFPIPDIIDKISVSLLVNNLFNKLYVNHGYHYTYNDTWTDPSQAVTYEGVGYYPQATRNYLLGFTFEF
jgi:iron complex outermembrane receptor protein